MSIRYSGKQFSERKKNVKAILGTFPICSYRYLITGEILRPLTKWKPPLCPFLNPITHQNRQLF